MSQDSSEKLCVESQISIGGDGGREGEKREKAPMDLKSDSIREIA